MITSPRPGYRGQDHVELDRLRGTTELINATTSRKAIADQHDGQLDELRPDSHRRTRATASQADATPEHMTANAITNVKNGTPERMVDVHGGAARLRILGHQFDVGERGQERERRRGAGTPSRSRRRSPRPTDADERVDARAPSTSPSTKTSSIFWLMPRYSVSCPGDTVCCAAPAASMSEPL